MLIFMLLFASLCGAFLVGPANLGTNSSCAGALNFDKYRASFERKNFNISKSRIYTDSQFKYIKAKSRLALVNAGPGSTGTSELYEIMCNIRRVHSWHSPWHCGMKKLDEFTILFGQCHSTALSSSIQWKAQTLLRQRDKSKGRIDPRDLLRRMYMERVNQLTTGFFVTDTPVAEIFHELLLLSRPSSGAIMTLRDPHSWAVRRVANYGTTLICLEKFWNHPMVLHPFDTIGCFLAARSFNIKAAFTSILDVAMEARQFVTDQSNKEAFAKVNQSGNGFLAVKEAYIQMNTVNWILTETAGKPVLPICLWDHPKRSDNKLRFERQMQMHTELIQPFLRRHKIDVDMTDLVSAKAPKHYPHGKR